MVFQYEKAYTASYGKAIGKIDRTSANASIGKKDLYKSI